MSKTLTICPHCQTLNRVERAQSTSKKPTCGKCGSALELQGMVTEVDEKGLQRILAKADKPVIVDFWASWCGPCQSYGPVFKEASLQSDKAIFLKVNTEKNPALSQKLGIRGIPATVVFKNGKEFTRQAGALPLGEVLRMVQ